jgi:hemerythrin superfamily protein
LPHNKAKPKSAPWREDNYDDFFGIGESFMIILQQHNMKEEQMLYPIAWRC